MKVDMNVGYVNCNLHKPCHSYTNRPSQIYTVRCWPVSGGPRSGVTRADIMLRDSVGKAYVKVEEERAFLFCGLRLAFRLWIELLTERCLVPFTM